MSRYSYRPSKRAMAASGWKYEGQAQLTVGAPYRVRASGNYPDLVGAVGTLKRNLPYRRAVRLMIDGVEYEFTADQLEKVGDKLMPTPEQPDAFEQMKAVPANPSTPRARYTEQDVMALVEAIRFLMHQAEEQWNSARFVDESYQPEISMPNDHWDRLESALVPFAGVEK